MWTGILSTVFERSQASVSAVFGSPTFDSDCPASGAGSGLSTFRIHALVALILPFAAFAAARLDEDVDPPTVSRFLFFSTPRVVNRAFALLAKVRFQATKCGHGVLCTPLFYACTIGLVILSLQEAALLKQLIRPVATISLREGSQKLYPSVIKFPLYSKLLEGSPGGLNSLLTFVSAYARDILWQTFKLSALLITPASPYFTAPTPRNYPNYRQ